MLPYDLTQMEINLPNIHRDYPIWTLKRNRRTATGAAYAVGQTLVQSFLFPANGAGNRVAVPGLDAQGGAFMISRLCPIRAVDGRIRHTRERGSPPCSSGHFADCAPGRRNHLECVQLLPGAKPSRRKQYR